MKYYVNKIEQPLKGIIPLKDGEYYVGLFTQCETKGVGSFCGYHASEMYLNTHLIAYCKYKENYLSERVGDVVLASKRFSKIQIATHMWTKVIEASSLKEAVDKFKNSNWRDWTNELDEINKENQI